MSTNTFCYYYKGHVASSDLLDTDTEFLSLDLLKLDKDKGKVIKVVTYS
jgi:hypothetical protein